MENRVKTQEEREREIKEMNDQFGEFLRTKGIIAKFRIAFAQMGESARRQHEEDVRRFEAVKERSKEENRDFYEFLHTKGIKAKIRLVIENIKRGIKEAPEKTAREIARVQAETEARIRGIGSHSTAPVTEYTAKSIEEEFAEFLKHKGLADRYTVTVTEE